MELISAEIPRDCTIIAAGDWHYGSAACDIDAIKEMISVVEKGKNHRLVLTGDQCEAIQVDDPRYEVGVHDCKLTPLKQAEDVARMLKPIAKKILGINFGNHELKQFRVGDLTRDVICKELKVPYLGWSGKISMTHKGKAMWKLHSTHSRLSANSKHQDPSRRLAANQSSLKARLSPLAADCLCHVAGHSHQLFHLSPQPEIFLHSNDTELHSGYSECEPNHHNIPPHHRWYVNSGSFMRSVMLGMTCYSEVAGYAPIPIGYSEIECGETIRSVKEVRVG